MKKADTNQHHQSNLVQTLEPLFDYLVQNAFTNAHRPHATMIGFSGIPNIAGPLIVNEIKAIDKFKSQTNKNTVFLLGGVKIFDYFDFLENALKDNLVGKILVGGCLADLCLIASGIKLGKKEEWLKKTDSLAKEKLIDLLPKAKSFLKDYADIFVLPDDIAVNENGQRQELLISDLPSNFDVLDIGQKTIDKYAKIIKGSQSIFIKGPIGAYDIKGFANGSLEIMKAVGESSAYSFVGGGHSADLASEIGIDKFSHVSLAGGATMEMLAGKKLPAIEFLKNNYLKFKTQ
ncbi:MAG: hypothetical protein ACD_68C00104G0002 [uncultured bacterium]|nr:MAG: hypothetical protein ACD_68C00104G0002 [uncultured bacterium]